MSIPEAGSICEMTTNDGYNWRLVRIIFSDDYVVLVGEAHGPVNREIWKTCDADVAFREFKSPEQIASEERDIAAVELAGILAGHDAHVRVADIQMAKYLYDLGYRKQ